MFMLYHSVHSKERLQTRLQTNCRSIHLFITSPILMRKQKCKQGMWKVGEPRGQDRFGKKYHGYAPESQVQNSLQAQRCRVQCYDFGVRKKLFLKKARACACHTLHTGMYVQYDMEGDNAMCFNQMRSALETKWKIYTFVLHNIECPTRIIE